VANQELVMQNTLARIAIVILVLASTARLEADVKTFAGEWTLTFQGGRGPQGSNLTIRETNGRATATLETPGGSIPVTDVTEKGDALILRYKAGGGDVEGTMTITMQKNGTLKVVNQVGQNKQEGTGKTRCPPDCRN
jgi:hypothetical protein